MNERNKEFVAKKGWDAWQVLVFIGTILVMIVAAVLLRTIWWMMAFLFVLGLLSLYYMKNTFKAEYAYTISNKLTVEVLKSGGKRKSVYECFFSDVTFFGKYAENSEKAEGCEIVKAATSVNDESTYIMVIEREGKKTTLLFTPNDMMLSELKKYISNIA